MVKTCCAAKCSNICDKENGISLHRFPSKNPELLARWIEAVKKDNWQWKKSSMLCSAHFKRNDFYPNQSRTSLKENAVPSIFAHSPAVERIPSPRKQENLEVRSTAKDILIVFILPVMLSSTCTTSTSAGGVIY